MAGQLAAVTERRSSQLVASQRTPPGPSDEALEPREGRLLDYALALSGCQSQDDVVETALGAFLTLLPGTRCCVAATRQSGLVVIASRGLGPPRPGELLPVEVARWIQELPTVRAQPRDLVAPERLRSILAGAGLQHRESHLLAVPLGVAGEAPRAMLIEIARGPMPSETRLRFAIRVADLVGHALERAETTDLAARHLQLMAALRRGGALLAAQGGIDVVLQELAPCVRRICEADIIDIHLSDARAAALFGVQRPRGPLASLVRQWRRRPPEEPAAHDGLLAVPLAEQDDVLGVLRVRVLAAHRFGPTELRLLHELGADLAQSIASTMLRAQAAQAERNLAVAEERERIARDLHDTMGQTLFVARVQLITTSEQSLDAETQRRLERIGALLEVAQRDLRDSVDGLALLEYKRQGLVAALRSLARRCDAPAPFDVDLRISGRSRQLPPHIEECLYRVAHQSLSNAERHARASLVTVRLRFEPNQVVLEVADDGTGLAEANVEPRLHFGLRTMQRRLREVGGELTIRSLTPHGLALRAAVPTGREDRSHG